MSVLESDIEWCVHFVLCLIYATFTFQSWQIQANSLLKIDIPYQFHLFFILPNEASATQLKMSKIEGSLILPSSLFLRKFKIPSQGKLKYADILNIKKEVEWISIDSKYRGELKKDGIGDVRFLVVHINK